MFPDRKNHKDKVFLCLTLTNVTAFSICADCRYTASRCCRWRPWSTTTPAAAAAAAAADSCQRPAAVIGQCHQRACGRAS
jgi:hypothetical protein